MRYYIVELLIKSKDEDLEFDIVVNYFLCSCRTWSLYRRVLPTKQNRSSGQRIFEWGHHPSSFLFTADWNRYWCKYLVWLLEHQLYILGKIMVYFKVETRGSANIDSLHTVWKLPSYWCLIAHQKFYWMT